MSSPLAVDQKYYGTVRRRSDSQIVPPNEMIVFRAKDNAVPAMLAAYLAECEKLGCGQDHLTRVAELIDRTSRWRANNSQLCKNPD